MEESRTADDHLNVVEGMQFERGFVSPYFVTDPERMVAEYETCNVLLVDKKITTAREVVGLLEQSIRSGRPLMIMAEDFEQVCSPPRLLLAIACNCAACHCMKVCQKSS